MFVLLALSLLLLYVMEFLALPTLTVLPTLVQMDCVPPALKQTVEIQLAL